jgi:hypothetical protein
VKFWRYEVGRNGWATRLASATLIVSALYVKNNAQANKKLPRRLIDVGESRWCLVDGEVAKDLTDEVLSVAVVEKLAPDVRECGHVAFQGCLVWVPETKALSDRGKNMAGERLEKRKDNACEFTNPSINANEFVAFERLNQYVLQKRCFSRRRSLCIIKARLEMARTPCATGIDSKLGVGTAQYGEDR